MEVVVAAISVIELRTSLRSQSRPYKRPFADFLPRVTRMGQDQFRPFLSPKKNLPSSDIHERPVEEVNAPEVQSISKVQQEAMKQHEEAVCLMVSGLERIEMPKRESLFRW